MFIATAAFVLSEVVVLILLVPLIILINTTIFMGSHLGKTILKFFNKISSETLNIGLFVSFLIMI